MQVFIMHIGHQGSVDIDYTITKKRTFNELKQQLPEEAPELSFIKEIANSDTLFPNGEFNCWGVPSGAEPRFNETQLGDLVLFIPHIGEHSGGVYQLGVIKAKCPIRSHALSRILWPETPEAKLYPFIFFFDTEIGFRDWQSFLQDVGYKPNWNPNGYYRKIVTERFSKFSGPTGYLSFLRSECGFANHIYKYLLPEEGVNEDEEPYHLTYLTQSDYISRSIKARRGQQKFRNDLIERYKSKCVITGCNILEVLDAAHIQPFRNIEENNSQNGLLLRTDIHTLFDLDLLGIHPETLNIHIHPKLMTSEYNYLLGQSLMLSGKEPSRKALNSRWIAFQQKLED